MSSRTQVHLATSQASDVVKICQVKKTYALGTLHQVHALAGVDLTITQGQFVAIMGPSGSGKSTLMNILGCLDPPTQGDYFLAGQNVAHMTDDQLSQTRGQKLGFIFQAFNLISQLTILQNVEVPLFYRKVPPKQRHAQAQEALARVGLADRAHHRPSQLSGGQQQRAAIARALVNNPQLLLADEPTGNLDTHTGQAILALFDQLHAQGMSIITVTHDESVAARCQRIIRLRDGLIQSDQMNTSVQSMA